MSVQSIFTNTKSPIEALTPGVSFSFMAYRQSMRHSTSHLDYIFNAFNQTWDIGALQGLLSYTQNSISVAPHAVDVASFQRNKGCVLFSTADLLDNDIEATYLRESVHALVTSNA